MGREGGLQSTNCMEKSGFASARARRMSGLGEIVESGGRCVMRRNCNLQIGWKNPVSQAHEIGSASIRETV